MAIEDSVVLDGIASTFPVEIFGRVLDLILILKAIGIVAIVYIIYAATMGILNYRRMRKLGSIDKKMDLIDKKMVSIDKKLNKLLKKKG